MEAFEHPVHFSRDSTEIWTNYYSKRSKSGSGIGGYHGDIYQRGNGIFGDLFKMALPVVKYLGAKTANTLLKSGADALRGENFVESLKSRGKEQASNIVSEIADKTSSLIGKGKKRGRKRKSKVSAKRKKSNKNRETLFV